MGGQYTWVLPEWKNTSVATLTEMHSKRMYPLFLVISKINKAESKLILQPDKKHDRKTHLLITLGLVFIGHTEVRSIYLSRQSTQHCMKCSTHCAAVLGGTNGVGFWVYKSGLARFWVHHRKTSKCRLWLDKLWWNRGFDPSLRGYWILSKHF